MLKKYSIITLVIFIFSFLIQPVFAMSEDEVIIGFCSTFYPIGNSTKQVVCTKKGNQQICQERYNPATVKSCKSMMEKMGLLKPGESAMSILFKGTSTDMSKEEKTELINYFYNHFNEF